MRRMLAVSMALAGLALRIVPSRPIDDGWTVRFTPPKDKPAELAVSVSRPDGQ